ncbi:MAG: ECF-type sigma factor [Lysobacterales bacterium]
MPEPFDNPGNQPSALDFDRLRSELDVALPELLPMLYADLRRLAVAQRRRLGGPETLNTTALVSELYLRLQQGGSLQVHNRRHFFALSALAMRQILTDHARRAVHQPEAVADPELAGVLLDDPAHLLEIDDLLTRLEGFDPRLAQVVTCRYFGGYSDIETAEILGITSRTVRRDWERARRWMSAAIGPRHAS